MKRSIKADLAFIRSLDVKAEKALKEAVYDLIKERQRTDDKLVIWRNGKVVRVPAKSINIRKLNKK